MTLVEGDAWHVDATVRGSRLYDVKLSREHDEIRAWCTCPYCEGEFVPCKHIWATLLAAESKGYLEGDGRRPVRDLTLDDPYDLDDDDPEGEEWFETSRPLPDDPPQRRRRRFKGPVPTTPADDPGVEGDLVALQATTRADAGDPLRGPPPGHELVYVVDLQASKAGNGLMLEVATRHRKKDGEWSKPKGRRFAQSDIAHLPEPADRQAMAILAGGREQVSSSYYYGSTYYSYDSAPARYLLTPRSARPCCRSSAPRAAACCGNRRRTTRCGRSAGTTPAPGSSGWR